MERKRETDRNIQLQQVVGHYYRKKVFVSNVSKVFTA